MAFKISAPYVINNTPVYNRKLEKNVMGHTLKNGTIIVNEKLNPKQIKNVIKHEEVHVAQFKSGELDYDEKNIYWRGKRYKRTNINMGSSKNPWEIPAYKKQDYV